MTRPVMRRTAAMALVLAVLAGAVTGMTLSRPASSKQNMPLSAADDAPVAAAAALLQAPASSRASAPASSRASAPACEYTPQSWSDCSARCDGTSGTATGQRTRTLTATSTRGCRPRTETEACSVTCPVDCRVSSWSPWSACSERCNGTQTRRREVLEKSQHGGAPCPALLESRACNVQARCPRGCEVTAWSPWTNCTATCGGGTHTRLRAILAENEPGGARCPALRDTRACNTQPCPIDCRVSQWQPWSNCSAACGGGLQHRTRVVAQEPDFGGAACPNVTDARACNTQPCPVDCRVSQWQPWSNCSATCGGGLRTRNRTVTTPARHGGAACPALQQAAACNTQLCPVDCQLSPWTPWSRCSRQCHGGNSTRTRTVVTSAKHGGAPCGALAETVACNTHPCPQDCLVTEWSPWANCSAWCGNGTQARVRDVVRPASHAGQACPALNETRACMLRECPVDCEVGPWSPWANCSAACGNGTQARHRAVLRADAHGGRACPVLHTTRPCKLRECPIDCRVSAWSPWSRCSEQCGPGRQSRTRVVLQADDFGGAPCPELTQWQACNARPCPVPCQVSAWRNASLCDSRCGTGRQVQVRSVTQPPLHGGDACPALRRAVPCAQWPCARPVLASDGCRQFDGLCAACVSDPGCGFAANLGLCLQGSALGPQPLWSAATGYMRDPRSEFVRDANITDWQHGYCRGSPCAAYSGCAACLADPSCGWCGESSSCMRVSGLVGGPADGACSIGWVAMLPPPGTAAPAAGPSAAAAAAAGGAAEPVAFDEPLPVVSTRSRPRPDLLERFCTAAPADRYDLWRAMLAVPSPRRPADSCLPCSGAWPHCDCSHVLDPSARLSALAAAQEEAAARALSGREAVETEAAITASMRSAAAGFETAGESAIGAPPSEHAHVLDAQGHIPLPAQ